MRNGDIFSRFPQKYIFASLSAQIALVAVNSNGLLAQPQKNATVQPAPFVKPHCVLIVANATFLLIDRRSAHTDVRLQKHASIFLQADICMVELLLGIILERGETLFLLKTKQ